jgi:hypothetical protein
VVNDVTINEFVKNLSSEDWKLLYRGGDVDSKFNSFLNIFLKIFEKSLPIKTEKKLFETNVWISKGIKTSCKHKRVLYQISKTSNNQLLKKHYRKYCKILTQVIKEAKGMHFNKLIVESDNKVKTV